MATVGNVVGSNIFNLTVIVGLAALVRPLTITGNTIKLEYPAQGSIRMGTTRHLLWRPAVVAAGLLLVSGPQRLDAYVDAPP